MALAIPRKSTSARKRTLNVPPTTKTADNKGRIALGGSFANRQVIIEQISETEIVVKMARVIPESEAWLYDNPAALSSVRRGLSQARAGALVEGPNVAADEVFAKELEG